MAKKKKAVVFTFGRFQPPTIGHEKLINAVIAHARKIGAEHRIYASQTYDGGRPRAAIKNPLQYKDKLDFLRQMFPQANIVKGTEDTNTFMRVLYELQKEGYTTVHVVVGGDRVPEIEKTVKPYLGSDDSETGLNFENFKIVSAGRRDPEAEGVEGMSASKLRAAAAEDDFSLFQKGMPKGFRGARKLFDAIRKGLERPMKSKKKSKVNEALLNEVTPPDDKSERFAKKAKASFKDRYGDDWASYLYGTAWKQYNKRHGKKTKTRLGEPIEVEEGFAQPTTKELVASVKWLESILKDPKKLKESGLSRADAEDNLAMAKDMLSFGKKYGSKVKQQVKEETLQEGGVKGALEDYLYSIPKEAIEELKPAMKVKNLTKRFAMITKVLKKHGFTKKFMGSMPANVVNDYYPTFFGESVELGEAHYRKADKTNPTYIPSKWAYDQFFKILKDSNVLFNQLKAEEALEYEFTMGIANPKSRGGSMGDLWDDAAKRYRKMMGISEVTIPRNAEVVSRNKEEKTVTLTWRDKNGWHEEEVPEDEVPGFYDRADQPLKKRKTDKTGKPLKKISKSQEKKISAGVDANKETAEDLISTIDKKPMGTAFTIFGTKQGKKDEYSMTIQKRRLMGKEVYIVKSSGRQVELRPAGTGLQIIDIKTKKMLLDRGRDMTW